MMYFNLFKLFLKEIVVKLVVTSKHVQIIIYKICLINVIALCILNHPCLPGRNLIWSWWMTVLKCCTSSGDIFFSYCLFGKIFIPPSLLRAALLSIVLLVDNLFLWKIMSPHSLLALFLLRNSLIILWGFLFYVTSFFLMALQCFFVFDFFLHKLIMFLSVPLLDSIYWESFGSLEPEYVFLSMFGKFSDIIALNFITVTLSSPFRIP